MIITQSVRTLTRITSTISSVDDVKLLKAVLDSFSSWQRKCAVMWDEVYIKSNLTYHGGSLVGKAVDQP